MTVTAMVYEERLAAEGLAPIDVARGRGIMADHTRGESHASDVTAYDAAERWQAWARAILADRSIWDQQRADATVSARDVWKLHAAGKSNQQVARALRTSRAVVQKALRFVERRAPPPPVVNPWRRLGRDGAETKLRLVPRGETNMAEKNEAKPAVWTRFSVIQMRSTETIDVPWSTVKKSQIVDIDGRYTPFGIEVRYEDKGYAPLTDEDGKVTYANRSMPLKGADLVLLIPGYKIAQAERVVEGSR